MKQWFRYESGFVNIDESAIFMTSTGNWTETKTLFEKTHITQSKRDFKAFRKTVFILSVIAAAIAVFVLRISMYERTFFGAGIGIAGYALYKYIRADVVASFKIPIEKLTAIHVQESTATFQFINGDSVSDTQKMTLVEEKGLRILSELQSNISSSNTSL